MGVLSEKVTPLEAKLTHADDRIRLNDWLPPQWGVVPQIRLGKRWFSVLWLLPLAFLFLLIGVAVVQELRQIPAIQAFLERYPGHTISPLEWHGFPLWMRCMHFFNLFLMFLIIRAGIQILADHPRLYWNVNCTPGTEWFRFQHPVPTGRIWTAKDDSVNPTGLAGHSRLTSFDRPCPLVAFLLRFPMANQRGGFLRDALRQRAVGETGAAHVGGRSKQPVGGHSVPLDSAPAE